MSKGVSPQATVSVAAAVRVVLQLNMIHLVITGRPVVTSALDIINVYDNLQK
jgi:hypothetical protein